MRREEDSAALRALRALCQQAGEQAAGWQPDSGLSRDANASGNVGIARHAPRLRRALLAISALLGLAAVAVQIADVVAGDVVPAAAVVRALPATQPVLPTPATVVRQTAEWQGSESKTAAAPAAANAGTAHPNSTDGVPAPASPGEPHTESQPDGSC